MTTISVLVVEDHATVRRQICALLSKDSSLSVVGQSPDGEDALAKVQELKPNLILLDIGLPGMSGIDAARRIREISPESRIIFLSQHDAPQIVKEAFGTGARGYVVKIDAGSDLLHAVRTVQEGKQFVNERLAPQALMFEN